jgi:hypothetical protein
MARYHVCVRGEGIYFGTESLPEAQTLAQYFLKQGRAVDVLDTEIGVLLTIASQAANAAVVLDPESADRSRTT